MLTDIYRWLLNRFDLRFTAQMIIKEGICIVGGICGDISQYLAKNMTKEEMGVNGSLTLLRDQEVINNELRKRLKDLWGQRNNCKIERIRCL